MRYNVICRVATTVYPVRHAALKPVVKRVPMSLVVGDEQIIVTFFDLDVLFDEPWPLCKIFSERCEHNKFIGWIDTASSSSKIMLMLVSVDRLFSVEPVPLFSGFDCSTAFERTFVFRRVGVDFQIFGDAEHGNEGCAPVFQKCF